MSREVAFSTVVAFVEKRRKSEGGYGATPRLPPTIEDTFEAVAIAGALAELAPGTTLAHPPDADPALHHYLQTVSRREWPGLRTTWQLIATCRSLGIAVESERGRKYLNRRPVESDDLYTAYYSARISASLGLADPVAPGALALPPRLTVAATRMVLELWSLAGATPAAVPDELIPWLRRCQNGDGGFGFFPGTTSFVENCHHCLAALHLLGATPSEPEKARQFLLSCQTGTGGFGRNLRAAPFLEATWHALAGLCLLR